MIYWGQIQESLSKSIVVEGGALKIQEELNKDNTRINNQKQQAYKCIPDTENKAWT